MKLIQVILKNFRGYQNETRIDLDDLTAFIGKMTLENRQF